MTECVFCAILRGRLPASVIYEDDRAVGFLDIHPIHAGHTLVIPRDHFADAASCPSELAAHLFEISVRLGPAIVRATDAHGFNVWTAIGRAAGQDVFHLHLHILPRYREDTFGLRFPKGYPEEAQRADLDVMAAKVRLML
jgi:histidine triad (HIT) family protein